MESIYYVMAWACHRRCKHCYEDRFRPYVRDELAGVIDEAVANFPRIIDHFPQQMRYVDLTDPQADGTHPEKTGRIILSGGESLMDPVREAVTYPVIERLNRRYAAVGGVKVCIQTTGDLLNDRIVGELVERGVYMISVASVDDFHVGLEGPARQQAFIDKLSRLFERHGVRRSGLLATQRNWHEEEGPLYSFFGATPDSWIGKLWPRGRAWQNSLPRSNLSDNFCNRWSGGLNFLRHGFNGSEVSVEPDGSVYPCCVKTALPLGNLLDEPLIDILDSLADVPAYQAINAGQPDRMGFSHGWDEARFHAASRTTLPDGTPYENLCIGCDDFHRQVLGPVLDQARQRRDAKRGVAAGASGSQPTRRVVLMKAAAGAVAAVALLKTGAADAQPAPTWPDVLARAKGQTVYWNAWAGDEKTNAFIAWCGEQLKTRHGVTVQHVRLKDTAEAVTRVVAEKTAGRDSDGSVDLVWINGPNFLAMKQQGLLYGPVLPLLPNARFVDTVKKRSNVIDFTTPVDGLAVPWRMAQVVFVYDSARIRQPSDVPRSAAAMLEWARRNPGRLTHPNVNNFMGSTFLKQALVDLLPDPSVLQRPAGDADFAQVTAPLWTWYDALRPLLWRKGQQFPDNAQAQRQLLNDGEIDITVSFNPSEAAVSAEAGLLPATVRSFAFSRGAIGNTSFVAIPYNAAHKEGALVLANFLIEPSTQARAQDLKQLGNQNVLHMARLSAADRALFDQLTPSAALPTLAELGPPLLEPHASWMTRITAEWNRRVAR